MTFGKKEVQKWGQIGAMIGAIGWLLGLMYNFLFKAQVAGQVQASLDFAPLSQGIKDQIQAGIPTDLASRIIGWLNGLLPLDFMGI